MIATKPAARPPKLKGKPPDNRLLETRGERRLSNLAGAIRARRARTERNEHDGRLQAILRLRFGRAAGRA